MRDSVPTSQKTYSRDVLILGDASGAQDLLSHLQGMGLSGEVVKWVDENSVDARARTNDELAEDKALFQKIEHVDGEAGRFLVVLSGPGSAKHTFETGVVVLALEPKTLSPQELWEVEGRVYSVKDAPNLLPAGPGDRESGLQGLDRIVFLSGFKHTSNPFTQARAIELAIHIRSRREAPEVLFLLEHFKAAAPSMERLFRQARESGVLFVKLTGAEPHVEGNETRIKVSYLDETIGKRVELEADALIVEDTVNPPPSWVEMARALRINMDSKGYFQADNVRNLPIFTARRGIYVLGSSKGLVSPQKAKEEAGAVATAIWSILKEARQQEKAPGVTIDTGKCAMCLTCFRSCPHSAVEFRLGDRWPVFSPVACLRCGICVSSCPGGALSLEEGGATASSSKETVILACKNSAHDAYMLASMKGAEIGEGIRVEKVPCGGSIGVRRILEELENGTKRVVVMVCPHESCKSILGSKVAQQRCHVLGEQMKAIDADGKQILYYTISPGSDAEFLGIIRQWV